MQFCKTESTNVQDKGRWVLHLIQSALQTNDSQWHLSGAFQKKKMSHFNRLEPQNIDVFYLGSCDRPTQCSAVLWHELKRIYTEKIEMVWFAFVFSSSESRHCRTTFYSTCSWALSISETELVWASFFKRWTGRYFRVSSHLLDSAWLGK